MRRRSLLGLPVASTLLGALAPPRALAQSGKGLRRVGLLIPGAAPAAAADAQYLQAFRDGLRERGLVEGRDVAIEVRYANGRQADLAPLAAEIAALKPAVWVAIGGAAARAALGAAPNLPIAALTGDFRAAGLAADFGHPEGRVTGVSFLSADLDAKRLELLAVLLPKGSAVLNLGDPAAITGAKAAIEATGRNLGLTLHAATARTPEEIDAAFATARRLRVAGVNVLSSPFLNNERARIIELAAGARLPAIYQWPESAEAGGLMAYGARLSAIFRQLGVYAARILDGAKPAELPIEQPTRFELVINLKTAKALGITMPQSLLLRADEVIQ